MVWSVEQTLQARCGNAAGGAISVSQVAAGQEVHRLVRSAIEMADTAAAGPEPTPAAPVADEGRWQREGWCAFAADGSRVECPRPAANENELRCAGKQKTGPQLVVTTLLHMGTGVPWDFRIGPETASERRHLEEMLPDLPPQSLVVADAGFTGYAFYRRIVAAKQSFLLRVGSNVQLLKDLGSGEQEGRDTVYCGRSETGATRRWCCV